MKLTRTSLAARARELSGDIDGKRWELAALASTARQQGLADYAAIIGAACRRSESTVSHWARTREWLVEAAQHQYQCAALSMPYSFFETCARYSDRIDTAVLCELLMTYHENAGATLESFRAELATMAGAAGDVAEFRTFLGKTRRAILARVDRSPTQRGGEYLRAAADALSDAMAEMGERVAA